MLTNPAWDGKIVVMVWEHKHIANKKLELGGARGDSPASQAGASFFPNARANSSVVVRMRPIVGAQPVRGNPPAAFSVSR